MSEQNNDMIRLNHKENTIYIRPFGGYRYEKQGLCSLTYHIKVSPKVSMILKLYYLTKGHDGLGRFCSFDIYKYKTNKRSFPANVQAIDFQNIEKQEIFQKNSKIQKQFQKFQWEKTYKEFETLLDKDGKESEWQNFFKNHPHIFAQSLDLYFWDESRSQYDKNTTGNTIEQTGHRTDAFLFSEFTHFIEIKRPRDKLLEKKDYRGGVYIPSEALIGAVAQVDRGRYDFELGHQNGKVEHKAKDGKNTGDFYYTIRPKATVIIGKISEIEGYDDKIKSFHLYKTSLHYIDIITYDQLCKRVKSIAQIN